MLKQRIITALLLLAIFLPALFHPDPRWLACAGLVLVCVAAWEWGCLNNLNTVQATSMSGVCLVLCTSIWAASVDVHGQEYTWVVVSVVWFFLLVFFLLKGIQRWQQVFVLARNAMGVVLLTATWVALFQSKSIAPAYLFSVLSLVWTADIAAYFVGKKWGRHKLAPSISPGKSVEGLVGGLIGTALLAIVWLQLEGVIPSVLNGNLFSKLYSHGYLALIGGIFLLTLISAAGDLFESLMKRVAEVKDSSHLLPGHGGVLDRLDALLPTLPWALMLYLY